MDDAAKRCGRLQCDEGARVAGIQRDDVSRSHAVAVVQVGYDVWAVHRARRFRESTPRPSGKDPAPERGVITGKCRLRHSLNRTDGAIVSNCFGLQKGERADEQ